jgi:hypothetical protein
VESAGSSFRAELYGAQEARVCGNTPGQAASWRGMGGGGAGGPDGVGQVGHER